ncbi:hypothetical protein LY78DRAFT_371971 [Colletotrichum sublineola]|nr:hypothetical protein LY78DRAFT_371971 [Colletotrichum sublineola]
MPMKVLNCTSASMWRLLRSRTLHVFQHLHTHLGSMRFMLVSTLRYRHRRRVPNFLSKAHCTGCVSQVERNHRTCLLFSLIIPFGGHEHPARR